MHKIHLSSLAPNAPSYELKILVLSGWGGTSSAGFHHQQNIIWNFHLCGNIEFLPHLLLSWWQLPYMLSYVSYVSFILSYMSRLSYMSYILSYMSYMVDNCHICGKHFCLIPQVGIKVGHLPCLAPLQSHFTHTLSSRYPCCHTHSYRHTDTGTQA